MPINSLRRRTLNATDFAAASSKRRFKAGLERFEERILLAGSTYVVDSLGDGGAGSGLSGDLRYVLTQANGDPGSTIDFSVTGTIHLGASLPPLSADMTIAGPGVGSLTLQGGGLDSNFSILSVESGAAVHLSGLTIAGASSRSSGAAISNDGTLTIDGVTLKDNSAVQAYGGAIRNAGSLTLTNSTLSGNSAVHGAAIDNLGPLTLVGDTFYGNTAQGNGSIDNFNNLNATGTTFSANSAKYGGAIDNVGIAILTGCTLAKNSASISGGAIASFGTLLLTNCTLSGNSAKGNGGGVATYGMANVTGGSMSGNTAKYGGGIDNFGSLTLSGTVLSGNSAAANGGGLDNVETATVTNVTLSENAALNAGGGVINLGSLSLSKSKLSGNSAGGAGGGLQNNGTAQLTGSTFSHGAAEYGAGLDNLGTLTLTNDTLTANSASKYGGGIDNAHGSLTLTGSTLTGNVAVDGAGIDNLQAMMLSDDTLSGNVASGNGGGIDNFGWLELTNSTLSGNRAEYGAGLDNLGTALATDSTLAGNTARLGGGGMVNYGELILTSCTLTANQTHAGSGGGLANGQVQGAEVVMDNTLISGNLLDASRVPTPNDVVGAIAPRSAFNLIGNGDGLTGIRNGSHGNQIGSLRSKKVINARLGPLAKHGGPTLTVALLAGSPAINAGGAHLAYDAVTSLPLTTDQRGTGFIRTVGKTIDIGAYEAQRVTRLAIVTQPTPTVTKGVGFGIKVAAEDSQGQLVPSFRGQVTVALANGPAGVVLKGTLSVTAQKGVARFEGLTLTKAGAEQKLRISSPGLPAVTTNGFNVVAPKKSKPDPAWRKRDYI